MSVTVKDSKIVITAPVSLANDIANSLVDRIKYHADGIKDGTAIEESLEVIRVLNELITEIERHPETTVDVEF